MVRDLKCQGTSLTIDEEMGQQRQTSERHRAEHAAQMAAQGSAGQGGAGQGGAGQGGARQYNGQGRVIKPMRGNRGQLGVNDMGGVNARFGMQPFGMMGGMSPAFQMGMNGMFGMGGWNGMGQNGMAMGGMQQEAMGLGQNQFVQANQQAQMVPPVQVNPGAAPVLPLGQAFQEALKAAVAKAVKEALAEAGVKRKADVDMVDSRFAMRRGSSGEEDHPRNGEQPRIALRQETARREHRPIAPARAITAQTGGFRGRQATGEATQPGLNSAYLEGSKEGLESPAMRTKKVQRIARR